MATYPALSIRISNVALCTFVFIDSFVMFSGENLNINAFKYLYEKFEELRICMNKGRL